MAMQSGLALNALENFFFRFTQRKLNGFTFGNIYPVYKKVFLIPILGDLGVTFSSTQKRSPFFFR